MSTPSILLAIIGVAFLSSVVAQPNITISPGLASYIVPSGFSSAYPGPWTSYVASGSAMDLNGNFIPTSPANGNLYFTLQGSDLGAPKQYIYFPLYSGANGATIPDLSVNSILSYWIYRTGTTNAKYVDIDMSVGGTYLRDLSCSTTVQNGQTPDYATPWGSPNVDRPLNVWTQVVVNINVHACQLTGHVDNIWLAHDNAFRSDSVSGQYLVFLDGLYLGPATPQLKTFTPNLVTRKALVIDPNPMQSYTTNIPIQSFVIWPWPNSPPATVIPMTFKMTGQDIVGAYKYYYAQIVIGGLSITTSATTKFSYWIWRQDTTSSSVQTSIDMSFSADGETNLRDSGCFYTNGDTANPWGSSTTQGLRVAGWQQLTFTFATCAARQNLQVLRVYFAHDQNPTRSGISKGGFWSNMLSDLTIYPS